MAKSLLRIENGTFTFRTGNLDEIGAFIGSTTPSRTLVEGDCWIDTTTSTNFIMKQYDNATTWITQS